MLRQRIDVYYTINSEDVSTAAPSSCTLQTISASSDAATVDAPTSERDVAICADRWYNSLIMRRER
jgi:hypothetical protein